MNGKIINLYSAEPIEINSIRKITTAIRKKKQPNLIVFKDKILNDQCFDLKHHGGPDRVVHFFPSETYQLIYKKFPNLDPMETSGHMGENISTLKLSEKNVCIGDQIKIGGTILEVTEPRNPCSTIDDGFNQRGVFKLVYQTNRIGWFARVLQQGTIKLNDQIERIKNPHPQMTIDFVFQKVVKEKGRDLEVVKIINQINELSERYQKDCTKILNKNG